MKFVSRQHFNAAQDTKDRLRDLMHEYDISQEKLQDLAGVERSSVSRWTNPDNETYPDIFVIVNCLASNDEKGIAFAKAFLNYLLEKAGMEAHEVVFKNLDGKLDDEFRDIAKLEGRFAEVVDKDIEKAEPIARRLMEVAQRMMAEIRDRRKQSHG